ncbi:MAG: 2,3-bisphosphoglycerate-independent phosphoglycerate mutase [Pyrinomonadaceae bacterium]|nr:2,3-bisphosphoglycerate-independent phosphoglycerate mutase [Pyrinomonadaceae bacterium]MCX7640176.1 2,3-bisphosphoglycerate-independent phosphoglycerate mutase [Pyrinomonadaceae bacterium]MDW8303236.1 2,3-bisphosphoglycerate-independent phosphoglycerate mutase [Acidobacteriota bacterium]
MKKIERRPLVIVVVEGLGYTDKQEGNAVALAHMPYYDEIKAKYPFTLLEASGERVGLPKGMPGNSQVGYMNIGAGRVVKPLIVKIKEAIETGKFYENEVLSQAMERSKNSSLHLIGLLSDAEIHSSQEVLFALLRMAKMRGLENVFVHAILDGKDVPLRTADIYAEAVEVKMNEIGVGKIATLCGRYYAMDKDENWELTARAYTMLVHAEGERMKDAITAIRRSFLRGISDEYIRPIVLEDEEGNPIATIKDGDVVILFNHRGDRMRQLLKALSSKAPNKPEAYIVCLTEYEESSSATVAFPAESHRNTLAEIFSSYNLKNCRIAEGEKIQCVTECFNLGFKSQLERSIQISEVKNYILSPETASFKITDVLFKKIEADEEDIFIVDFSAPDKVSYSGDIEKTVESLQFVDTCIGSIVERTLEVGGVVVMTSTHGRCEEMIASNGRKRNLNSLNKVPFHLIDKESTQIKLKEDGALEDVAPTILEILGIEKPEEMTGKSLIEK